MGSSIIQKNLTLAYTNSGDFLEASVVVITHNRRELLEKTLRALIEQDFPKKDYEIIVVDDGSTDNTAEFVKGLSGQNKNLKYLCIENSGVSTARNTGAKNALHEIVAYVDSDCIPDKKWLCELVRPFSDGSVVGVEGKTANDGKRKLFYSAPENLEGGQYITCNIAYRKSLFDDIGFFEKSIKYWREDTEFAIRAMKKGKIIFNPDAIVIHPFFKVPFTRPIKSLIFIRNDLLLFSRFPKEYLKLIGFPLKKDIAFSTLSWLSFVSFIFSIFNSSLFPLLGAVFLFFIPKLAQLRGKEFSIPDFLAFISASLVRDLAFPFFLFYYSLSVLFYNFFRGARQ